MKHLLRDIRLVPVVLLATTCLLALKVFGLLLDGGYILGEETGPSGTRAARGARAAHDTQRPKQSPFAQDVFNMSDVTGSLGEKKPAPSAEKPKNQNVAEAATPKAADGKPADGKPIEPKPVTNGTPINLNNDRATSPAERAILERLQERRTELEARARELEIRESLLKSAEKRIEARVIELKDVESRASSATQKKEEADAARFKGLVTMYENMKAKDAAKIFDRLDLKILVEVASHINPRRMSDIMAQMAPEAAERLTVEFASRASATEKAAPGDDLPKIEGKPNGNGS
jgi:flagellar motility protein MotE (MotC chaperone)